MRLSSITGEIATQALIAAARLNGGSGRRVRSSRRTS